MNATPGLSADIHFHTPSSTDATVYPEPTKPEEPENKKRKRAKDEETVTSGGGIQTNAAHHGRFPYLMLANKHVATANEQVKKECEELARLCVSVFAIFEADSADFLQRTKSSYG